MQLLCNNNNNNIYHYFLSPPRRGSLDKHFIVTIFRFDFCVFILIRFRLASIEFIYCLMSVANFKGVSDMSIIYNSLIMEGSEGLFYVGCSLFNFICGKMRIQNKTLITLIIVTYWHTGVSTYKTHLMHNACHMQW